MKTRLLNGTFLKRTVLACALVLSASAASAANYSATLSGLNPIGYWRLNEAGPIPPNTATNSSTSGAALNGAYTGTATHPAAGALVADSNGSATVTGGTVTVPYNAALNPVGSFTVECWAYPTVSSGARTMVCSIINGQNAANGNDRSGWAFRQNNTDWQLILGYGNVYALTLTASGLVMQDTWQHVVAVYDASVPTAKIYLNGVEVASSTDAAAMANYVTNFAAPLIIGDRGYGGWNFNGSVDEVAVYPTALSPSVIASHYDNGTNTAPGTPYESLVLVSSPAAFFRLGEPAYSPLAAINAGSLGSAQNGIYSALGSTAGVAGPVRGQFAGFESDNKSVGLDGVSGLVTTPGFATTTDTVTITGWIKRNGTQDSAPVLLQRTDPASPATGLLVDGNRLGYIWNTDPATYSYNPGPDFFIPDGVWTFAAVVVTPANATLYIGSTNGLKSAINTVTHAVHDFSGGPIDIGHDSYGSTRFLKGNLDEVAIFDQALDSASISNLFYSATPAIPSVTRTPADPLFEGMTITFAAYGIGRVPVTYQWRKDGTNLSGKVASDLVLSNVGTNSSGNYDVVVTGGALSVTSAVSAISIASGPPIIVQQPASATRYEGAAVSFSVSIVGSVPWGFQWKKGATTDIPGATNSTYTLPAIKLADAGDYGVTITNPYGSTNSAAATLTVLPVDNYAAQVVYSGAGAYWQMNETAGSTAFDYAGGVNCTIVGAVTNNVVSVRPPTYAGYSPTNTCFAFAGANANGVGEYLATTAKLNFTNTSITMVAWVMPYSGLLTSDVNFVGSVGDNFGLNSSGADGQVRVHPLWWIDTGLTFSFDTWNYVVVIWTPSGATFYMDTGDGAGLRSSSISGSIDPSIWKSGLFDIGRQANGRSDRDWPGQIDELALFDRALTPAEVANLHLTAISGPTAPNIITEPFSQTVLAGQPVSFTVGASGAAPMTYQWRHAGTNIPGAISKTLTIPSTYYTDAGTYQVVLANGVGSPATSAAATLTVQAPATFANLTNNLVLHLRFDGNYADSSGRTNHAEAMNTPVFVAGRIGSQAVQVNTDPANSIYNYVQLWDTSVNAPYPDLSFTAADSFSVAFWVKYSNVSGDLPIIGNVINSTYNRGWVFAENYGGHLVWTAHGDVGAVDADGIGPVIKDGTWHHVVATFDRALTTAVTYIDGTQVDARSIEGLGTLDQGNAVCLGQDPTGTYGVSGTYAIDDVGIWRRALTPGQATGIYAAGQVGQSFDVNGPASLTLKKSGSSLELIWQQGTLQSVDNLGDTWVAVPGAVAPYHVVTPSAAKKFYRVKF